MVRLRARRSPPYLRPAAAVVESEILSARPHCLRSAAAYAAISDPSLPGPRRCLSQIMGAGAAYAEAAISNLGSTASNAVVIGTDGCSSTRTVVSVSL